MDVLTFTKAGLVFSAMAMLGVILETSLEPSYLRSRNWLYLLVHFMIFYGLVANLTCLALIFWLL